MIGLTITPVIISQNVFANHGQEMMLSLDYGHFQSLIDDEGNQVKALVNYTIQDQSILDQIITSVMKVYTLNGTLLKTSSSTIGDLFRNNGTEELATTLPNNTIQNVTALVTFIDTEDMPVSNSLTVKLNFGQTIQG